MRDDDVPDYAGVQERVMAAIRSMPSWMRDLMRSNRVTCRPTEPEAPKKARRRR